MPDCKDCKYLINQECTAWKNDWTNVPVNHIRACVVAINEDYCQLIDEGAKVLEIGCGTWSPIFEHCQAVGAHWEGIDVSDTYYGEQTIATRIESVENLSFTDNSFDYVIANQSLEHWVENGTDISLGLWQCFRVCKSSGYLLMNVPIHNHGSRIFVEGDLDKIKSYFEAYSNHCMLEMWRKNPQPLQSVKLLPPQFTRGYDSMYVVDIRAESHSILPEKPSPYRVRNRVFRELVDHRWDYLVYKIWRRILLFFRV